MRSLLNTVIEIKGFNDETGEFEGYASTFGNVDLGNDVVVKGAFDETLQEIKATGVMPALCFEHSLKNVIGEWLEMKTDAKGLWVKGKIWINKGIADAERAYAMLKSKGPKGLSIGFIAKAAKKLKNGVRQILKAALVETSIVGRPMNPEAQVISVKSADGVDYLERVAEADGEDVEVKYDNPVSEQDWTAQDCAACSGRALVAAKKNGSKSALNASTRADTASDAALLCKEDDAACAAHMDAAMSHSAAARSHSKSGGSSQAMHEHMNAARNHLMIASSKNKTLKSLEDESIELKAELNGLMNNINNALVKSALSRTLQGINPNTP